MMEPHDMISTCRLLTDASAGDSEASLLLLRRFEPLINSEAKHFAPDVHADARQEITCLVLSSLKKFRPPRHAKRAG